MNETTARIYTRRQLETALASALDLLDETLTPSDTYTIRREDIPALAGTLYALGGMETDISPLTEETEDDRGYCKRCGDPDRLIDGICPVCRYIERQQKETRE